MPNDLGSYGDPGVDADTWINKALESVQSVKQSASSSETVKPLQDDEGRNALYVYIALSILVALAFYFNVFKTLIPTALILANSL